MNIMPPYLQTYRYIYLFIYQFFCKYIFLLIPGSIYIPLRYIFILAVFYMYRLEVACFIFCTFYCIIES